MYNDGLSVYPCVCFYRSRHCIIQEAQESLEQDSLQISSRFHVSKNMKELSLGHVVNELSFSHARQMDRQRTVAGCMCMSEIQSTVCRHAFVKA